MGNIVNLGELVPGLEGKTFVLPRADGEEERYHVPGDLDSERVFEFLALFEDMVRFEQEIAELRREAADDETKVGKLLEEQLKGLRVLTEKIKAKLLAIFQLSNPELKVLPFGQATTMAVLGEILEMMGLASKEEKELPSPPPNRAARRATARKTTKRSTTRAAKR